MLTPFAKTYGLHFNDEMEPQDSAFAMIRESEKYFDKNNPYIGIPETYEQYIRFKEDWLNKMNSFIRVQSNGDDICYIRVDDGDGNISNVYSVY